ncbi:MAG: hypothetical protein NVSMB64_16150 [Candidatus Velthaea sp.]
MPAEHGMVTGIRIAIVLIGFGLIVAAELVERRHLAKPWSTGTRRADTFMDDAKVFTLRIAGAGFIVLSLLSFVIQNHVGAAPR